MRGSWIATVVVASGCGRVDFDSPGLLAAFQMDDLGGNRLVDTSGNGHDGTCTPPGCPTVVPGRSGNGLEFDGVDDLIRLGASPELDTTQGYTIAVWAEIFAAPTDVTASPSRRRSACRPGTTSPCAGTARPSRSCSTAWSSPARPMRTRHGTTAP